MNSILRLQTAISASRIFNPAFSNPTSVTNPSSVCYECVRWRKKPRWLPVAKTKMFRVPKRNILPEEDAEFFKLWNHYKTEMKAIRFYLAEKTKSQVTGHEVIAEQQRLDEELHAKCLEINEEWNKEVSKQREIRLAKEAEERKQSILEALMEHEELEKKRLEAIEAIVRAEKEKAKLFITRENIDAAIEKVLSETVDFNFAIDLDEKVYHGLRARPGVSNRPDLKEQAQIK